MSIRNISWHEASASVVLTLHIHLNNRSRNIQQQQQTHQTIPLVSVTFGFLTLARARTHTLAHKHTYALEDASTVHTTWNSEKKMLLFIALSHGLGRPTEANLRNHTSCIVDRDTKSASLHCGTRTLIGWFKVNSVYRRKRELSFREHFLSFLLNTSSKTGCKLERHPLCVCIFFSVWSKEIQWTFFIFYF